MEQEQPEPNVRRAYRALLGNAYEQLQQEHIGLSALTELVAADFDTAWDWRRAAIEDAMQTMPPRTYPVTLITDGGSALIPTDVWVGSGTPVGPKIAAFVAALKATFLVVSYAMMSGRCEYFTLLGTDGFSAREAVWSVEYKSFGRRNVSPLRRGEGKRADRFSPTQGDPTVELSPLEDGLFLSDAAFELRENRDAGA